MTSLERIIEMAKSLGIEGQAAIALIVSQQKIERDNREARRLANKDAAEAEERGTVSEKTGRKRVSRARRASNIYEK